MKKLNISLLFKKGLVLAFSAFLAFGVAMPTQVSAAETITKKEAKAIALKDAGLTKGSKKVTFIKVKKDYDDGRLIYDIEFYTNGKEYDYEIDAATGKILDYDLDIENFSIPTTSTSISKAKAKAIALKHAGLTKKEVTFLTVKKEYDDGTFTYDIEFYTNGKEYDYEIDATTGKILDYDLDIEDFSISNTSTPISKSKAQSIALSYVNLTGKNVTFTDFEKDEDDGRLIYEMEFYYDDYEYTFEIDANTGKVLDYEKESRYDD